MSENKMSEQDLMRSAKQEYLDHLREEIDGVFYLMGDRFADQYDMLTVDEFMELSRSRINEACKKMRDTARRVITEVPIDRIT